MIDRGQKKLEDEAVQHLARMFAKRERPWKCDESFESSHIEFAREVIDELSICGFLLDKPK